MGMHVDHAIAELAKRRDGRHLLLLFDFDGTLCPFHPDRTRSTRGAHRPRPRLPRVEAQLTVGIISGRRLPDCGSASRCPARSIWRVSRPRDPVAVRDVHAPETAAATETMRAIVERMRTILAMCPGVFIEDKVFSIALHFREAVRRCGLWLSRPSSTRRAPTSTPAACACCRACVVELLPAPHGTRAARCSGSASASSACTGDVTVYVGDDVTDETHQAVGPDGMTISRASGPPARSSGEWSRRRGAFTLAGWPENNRRA